MFFFRKKGCHPNHREALNGGFTLIECLVALVVMMGAMLFIAPLLKNVSRIEECYHQKAYIEMQIGKQQLAYETKELEFISANDKGLTYKQKTETVMFNQYKTIIRKQPGFQPIITDVKKSSFEEKAGVIRMYIQTVEGEEYVYFFSKGK